MNFNYVDLNTCSQQRGTLIVVDVLRAFSNAAYAFAAGAEQICLVAGVEEALTLKRQHPGWLVMGEVGGLPPAGFDLGNSPTQMVQQNLRGRSLVQRTGAGTQGVARSTQADTLFAASFVVASATVRAIRTIESDQVTFVLSGGLQNQEDLACAEYLEALFNGRLPDPAPYIQRVYTSFDAAGHLDPGLPEFPLSDLNYCTRIDAFDFAMQVRPEHGLLVMKPFFSKS